MLQQEQSAAVKLGEAGARAAQSRTLKFRVSTKNAYATGRRQEPRVVEFRLIDVLFNEEVCSLVYMQDVTKLLSEAQQ